MASDQSASIAADYLAWMIGLCRNVHGFTKGLTGQHIDIFHVNDKDKIIAFRRSYAGGAQDDVIVIANFANQRVENYEFGLPAGGTWKRRFSSDLKQYSEDFGGNASHVSKSKNAFMMASRTAAASNCQPTRY